MPAPTLSVYREGQLIILEDGDEREGAYKVHVLEPEQALRIARQMFVLAVAIVTERK